MSRWYFAYLLFFVEHFFGSEDVVVVLGEAVGLELND